MLGSQKRHRIAFAFTILSFISMDQTALSDPPPLHSGGDGSTAGTAAGIYNIYRQNGIDDAALVADITAFNGALAGAAKLDAAKKLFLDLKTAVPLSWDGTKIEVNTSKLDRDMGILIGFRAMLPASRTALRDAARDIQTRLNDLADRNGVSKLDAFNLFMGLRHNQAKGAVIDGTGAVNPDNTAALGSLESTVAKLNKDLGREVTGAQNHIKRADLAKLLNLIGVGADPAKPEGILVDAYLKSQDKVLEKLTGLSQERLQDAPVGEFRYGYGDWEQKLKSDLARAHEIGSKPAANRTNAEQAELVAIGRRIQASTAPSADTTHEKVREHLRMLGFDATSGVERAMEVGKAYEAGNGAQKTVMTAVGQPIEKLVDSLKGTGTDITPESYIEGLMKLSKSDPAKFNEAFGKLSSMTKESFLQSLGLNPSPTDVAMTEKAGKFVDLIHQMQTAKMAASSPSTLDGLNGMLRAGSGTMERKLGDWALDDALSGEQYPLAKKMIPGAAERNSNWKQFENSPVELMKLDGDLRKLMGGDGGTVNFEEMASRLHDLKLGNGYDREKLKSTIETLRAYSTKFDDLPVATDEASRKKRDSMLASKVAADLLMRRLNNVGAAYDPAMQAWENDPSNVRPKWVSEGNALTEKIRTASGDELLNLVVGRGSNERNAFNSAGYDKYMTKYNQIPGGGVGTPANSGGSPGGGVPPAPGSPGLGVSLPQFNASLGAYSVSYPQGMTYQGVNYPPGSYYLPQTYASASGGQTYSFYPDYSNSYMNNGYANNGYGNYYNYDPSAFAYNYQQPRVGLLGRLFGRRF